MVTEIGVPSYDKLASLLADKNAEDPATNEFILDLIMHEGLFRAEYGYARYKNAYIGRLIWEAHMKRDWAGAGWASQTHYKQIVKKTIKAVAKFVKGEEE